MTEHTKDYGQTEICLLLEKWMRKMTQWHFSFPAQNPESQSEPRSAQGLGLCPYSVFKSLYVAGVTLGGRLGDITQWYKHPALFIIQRPLLGRGAWPWPSVQGHTTALTGLAPPTPDLTPHPAPRAADGSLLRSYPEGSRSNRLIASDSKATWPFFSSDLIWPFCSCITVNPPSCLENRYSGPPPLPVLPRPPPTLVSAGSARPSSIRTVLTSVLGFVSFLCLFSVDYSVHFNDPHIPCAEPKYSPQGIDYSLIENMAKSYQFKVNLRTIQHLNKYYTSPFYFTSSLMLIPEEILVIYTLALKFSHHN